jgi:hypothetical protein
MFGQRSIGHDVLHDPAIARRQVRDHPPVATPPRRLAAHYRDMSAIGFLEQSLVCGQKLWCARVGRVVGECRVLPPSVLR